MKLHTYWRSATSHRARIGLNLKGVAYHSEPVNLAKDERLHPSFAEISPGRSVPALVPAEGVILTQSMAILDWLDETYPDPLLLPGDPITRAHIRAAAQTLASDIHPLNNRRVILKLKAMGQSQDNILDWIHNWTIRGFSAFEHLIAPDTAYAFGDTPGLADICLIPQLYNAKRRGSDLSRFARLTH
ncbi:MAG: maleylacetoacetate isomerase [Pseudomonadota bacterium]